MKIDGPFVFVVFGGTGDLMWRKLTPALFDMCCDQGMPVNFTIIAVGRAEMTDEALRDRLESGTRQFSRKHGAAKCDWDSFCRNISYLKGDLADPATYDAIRLRCEQFEHSLGARALRIFYMATPPAMFGVIPKFLGNAGLASDRQLARIVVEKPIGYDLESAQALNRVLAASFNESQIFRIDHYLGKENVQNVLALRFANPLFEPIWNRRYVDFVSITVAEAVGVENRGGYYDGAGALRDMVQNHLIQLLCLVAMEPMVSFEADEIRNKKVDVLHAVRPISHHMVHSCAVRGQYGRGWLEGNQVKGYREEDGVSPNSGTETFAALKLFIDNWRWQDVPFYLRTGKRLPRQVSEVVIQFRAVPHQSFPPMATLEWQPARLVMSIQPEEGIVLRFQAKQPGREMLLRPVDMRFSYRETFGMPSTEAYESLLWDVIRNDATRFMRIDQVEAAWRLVLPVLEVWGASTPSDFPNYCAGTWGPDATQGLLANQGHSWPSPMEPVRCAD